jgi:Na+/H+-dicarboxylate symporter
VGNGVATIVVSKWEKELNIERARKVLDGEQVVTEDEVNRPVMV